MTEQELITYFKNRELPDKLRIDRATTQYNVKAAVERNIEIMLGQPKQTGARHRLIQIQNALEFPFSGREIPKL
jgi:hypothetical protein